MYLTPEQITAAWDAHDILADILAALGCTRTRVLPRGPRHVWNVYTSDTALVFTGHGSGIQQWLRNFDPSCPFAELSPMRRDRLVAAFVSPGQDLLGGIREFAAEHGAAWMSDPQHVAGIWDGFARHGGWTYLECLENPASVASEALGLWQSQDPGDDRDDPGAYDD